MSPLLRLALAAAVLLLSLGTIVAPHVDPPTKPHLHVDHVPSAMRLIVLSKFSRLFVANQTSFVDQLASAQLASTAVLALLVFAFRRIWRPARLGVRHELFAPVAPQLAGPPAHAPPRLSFSA